MKTVMVLGGAYAGARTISLLSEGLPKDWRIILVDRNTHINHVYIFPRLAVLPGHEHKGFIPFSKLLRHEREQDLYLQASVRSVHPSYVVLDRSFPERGIPTPELPFDYLIYALGSTLPAPLDLWGSHPAFGTASLRDLVFKPYSGTKQEGMSWLRAHQEVVKDSASVLVVGGGALGIQFATDISEIYPDKTVTLLHSRHRLLPRFDEKMHNEILDTLLALDVEVILGERLDLLSTSNDTVRLDQQGRRIVKTTHGREIAADLILLCTGQKPNTHFLSDMDARCVNPDDGLSHVLRSMQLGILSPGPQASGDSETEQEVETTPYPNIFAIGDVADAFGAIPAGHTAYYQGEVAARNILRLIRRSEQDPNASLEEEPLELYEPGLPAIKISLGLTKALYQANGVVGASNDGVSDLNAAVIWRYFGHEVKEEADMYV
ncbi:hypothetical protein GYMLUDRAFT_89519 [Collybiopsis luxurians FD-317 M1]|nr:hypothetical protein GYMLUDRAFT_89519 [Collybiopsis luxurians FD-317 M1]